MTPLLAPLFKGNLTPGTGLDYSESLVARWTITGVAEGTRRDTEASTWAPIWMSMRGGPISVWTC